MENPGKNSSSWREWNSPFHLILPVNNAVFFGGCIALLACGASGGTLVMLSIGTGLLLGAGLAGAITASRKTRSCVSVT
jgi:hypothetical protein